MIKKINKKGSALDVIVWLVSGFVFIIFLGMIVYMFGAINTEFMNTPNSDAVNITDATEKTIGQVNQTIPSGLRTLAYVILIGGAISILMHNFLIKAHPVFFVVYVIMTIPAIILSVYVSNSYETILQNTTLGTALSGFTEANFIINYLPYVVAILGIMGGVFLFINIIRERDSYF